MAGSVGMDSGWNQWSYGVPSFIEMPSKQQGWLRQCLQPFEDPTRDDLPETQHADGPRTDSSATKGVSARMNKLRFVGSREACGFGRLPEASVEISILSKSYQYQARDDESG